MNTASTSEPPFPPDDADRRAIWDMLVTRDIGAYLAQDWAAVADDFTEGFFGVDARGSNDPDQWLPRFDSVAAYRDEWLRQATETATIADPATAHAALHAATDAGADRHHRRPRGRSQEVSRPPAAQGRRGRFPQLAHAISLPPRRRTVADRRVRRVHGASGRRRTVPCRGDRAASHRRSLHACRRDARRRPHSSSSPAKPRSTATAR